MLLCPFSALRCHVDVKSHPENNAMTWKAEGKYHTICSIVVVRLQCILQLYRKFDVSDSELNFSMSSVPRMSRDSVLPLAAGTRGEG